MAAWVNVLSSDQHHIHSLLSIYLNTLVISLHLLSRISVVTTVVTVVTVVTGVTTQLQLLLSSLTLIFPTQRERTFCHGSTEYRTGRPSDLTLMTVSSEKSRGDVTQSGTLYQTV